MDARSGPVTSRVRVLSLLLRYGWALPNTLIGLLFVPAAMLPRGRVQLIDGVLEAHGPVISAILRHCVPIASGASAITFGHVVLARDGWSLDATRVHERVHVRQYEIWGPAFIPAYLIAGVWGLMTGTGAYTGNYFERQAGTAPEGQQEMVRFKTLAIGIFFFVGVAHLLRIVFAWQVTIGTLVVPMWVSMVGAVVALLLVVMAWFERP